MLSLNYCLVTQNLASIIEDTIHDADRFPDVSNISGEVVFTPNIANGKAYQLVDVYGKTYTVPVSRIRAEIINGKITHEYETGIYLFAAGPGSNPDKITYTVEYRNLRSGELSFSLSPLKFEAIPGGEVDLTMATPVVGATPAGVIRGPSGTSLESIEVDGSDLIFTTVNDAGSFLMTRIPIDQMVEAQAREAARLAAEGVQEINDANLTASENFKNQAGTYADRAATSETNAKTSETNAKTSETNAGDFASVATTAATEAVDAMERATAITGGDFATREDVSNAISTALHIDTTVGTRVFAGDTMIYGDTGRRALASWDAEGNVTGNMPEGLIPTPNSPGYVVVRRENNLITMYIRGGEAAQNTVAVKGLPFGFSAVNETWELAFCRVGTFTDEKTALVRLGSGHVTFTGIAAGDKFGNNQYHVVFRWAPTDDWPTGLPGAPA